LEDPRNVVATNAAFSKVVLGAPRMRRDAPPRHGALGGHVDVARALRYLRAHNVLFRDLKPE